MSGIMQAFVGATYGPSVFRFNISTDQTDVNLRTLAVSAGWNQTSAVEVTIGSGVTIGGSSLGSSAALTIDGSWPDGVTLTNNGNIDGRGGAANSGDGGHAISSSQSFTLINSGVIRGGGGGGGAGGSGGLGQVLVSPAPPTRTYCRLTTAACTCPTGNYTCSKGGSCDKNSSYQYCFGNPTYAYYSGGAGGAGGQGTGYAQTLAAGSAGSAGGTNAGAGGTGGSGSTWATAGATGSTGANGNYTNGSAGSAGGAAGRAILMVSGSVTLTNTGTILGAY